MRLYDRFRIFVENYMSRCGLVNFKTIVKGTRSIEFFHICYPYTFQHIMIFLLRRKNSELFLRIEIGSTKYYIEWPSTIKEFADIKRDCMEYDLHDIDALEKFLKPLNMYRKYFCKKYKLR